jgi:signal transduction histidine kinase
LEGFATPGLYEQETYILSVLASLASILYAATYISTAISGELRKRQREVLDLTERELVEAKKLEEINERLVELNAEKSRFVTIASHDLKAPLAAIQSYLQVMLGGFAGEVAERQRHMMERCSERVKELLNFISDLLDISRIERGFIDQEMKPTILAQVMEDSLNSVRGTADEKAIKIHTEMPDGLPEIQAAAPRLQQVCVNLLSNAISYTPEKGQIWFKVEDREQCLEVQIMDTGMGIPPEDLPRIFEDFYRGSNVPSVEDRTKGAGLGLSIVKRIVESHGGQIWAQSPYPESPSGKGSKFTFTLPKNPPQIGKEGE